MARATWASPSPIREQRSTGTTMGPPTSRCRKLWMAPAYRRATHDPHDPMRGLTFSAMLPSMRSLFTCRTDRATGGANRRDHWYSGQVPAVSTHWFPDMVRRLTRIVDVCVVIRMALRRTGRTRHTKFSKRSCRSAGRSPFGASDWSLNAVVISFPHCCPTRARVHPELVSSRVGHHASRRSCNPSWIRSQVEGLNPLDDDRHRNVRTKCHPDVPA